MHDDILRTIREHPGLSALQIADRIGQSNLPSRVVLALNELRTDGKITVQFSGRRTHYYATGCRVPTPRHAGLQDGATLTDRVLAVLPEYGQKGLTLVEVGRAVGATAMQMRGSISPVLKTLCKRGLAVRTAERRGAYIYTLPAKVTA